MDKPIPDWLKERIRVSSQNIVSVKPVEMTCPDCDRTVKDRQTRASISRDTTRVTHVKHHCSICKFYKNPETGKYDYTFKDINHHYRTANFKK